MGRNYWYLLIKCKENLDGFQACFFREKVAAAPLQIGESHDFLLENPCKPLSFKLKVVQNRGTYTHFLDE